MAKFHDTRKFVVPGGGPQHADAGDQASPTLLGGVILGDGSVDLKSEARGPSTIQNSALSKKITHFDRPIRASDAHWDGFDQAVVELGAPSERPRSRKGAGQIADSAEAAAFITPVRALVSHAHDVAKSAFARAALYDEDGAYPAHDIDALHVAGLLKAPLPLECGGASLAGDALNEVLQMIGSGSLPLGRLFEGHVNALQLALRYGRREQIAMVAREACAGQLFGVWNTDDGGNLRIVDGEGVLRLQGRKILASGAGFIERPIVTATHADGRRLMVMPNMPRGERADLSQWTAQGMRASATGAVDFSGTIINRIEILGSDGDYERQPFFSGGAWRFAAVHVGGMMRLLALLQEHLQRTGRGQDPHQAARLGQAAIAVETARLWVARAAAIAEEPSERTADSVLSYVNLARLAVERAGLDLMEIIHRSVGLQSFMRPNPIERIARDLATYLRQPGPDRALTQAAAWVLEQSPQATDMWR